MNRRSFFSYGFAFGTVAALSSAPLASALNFLEVLAQETNASPIGRIVKTDEEWKRILTREQYYVTRQKGTEAPYSSPLNKIHAEGTFVCVCCELPLFSSKAKFDSHTGWPSFWTPIASQNVREETDNSLSETRTEVLCARCDAHLGHVFDDGPPPTGLRYCMNGVALKFVKKK
ncbi:MAG TPA: peptide-methionine (R)-S-oxide reductase MsrB [Pyrinomonadaceae bacterium]